MKTVLLALSLLLGTSAFANVNRSFESLDYGIVSGALSSKKAAVKAGAFKYHVISADLIEPACNSEQTVVFVEDANAEGVEGGVTYNLGTQSSGLVSVKAQGSDVIIKLRRNEVEDCRKYVVETYKIRYLGNGKPLQMKKL